MNSVNSANEAFAPETSLLDISVSVNLISKILFVGVSVNH